MAYLSLSQKERIVIRRCDGISVAQIAIEENISERTRRSLRSGRPPIFNDRKRRELGRVVRASRRATLKEISQLISTKACEDTIRNELKKLGYACRVAIKESFLNEKQQKARRLAKGDLNRRVEF
ncbi:hypothetical protein G6F70_001538 [Rhizopus microsporus]|nr:hypothetical protein G6F71_001807 [Rhizopus microsporus]KAG1203240.1 hypothetical protein G6F70_001538 [Rhizopus microsporus]KAG1216340.1 hypothetical protein G6F69_000102 [Rhizopus microsporus]KAG1268984.1 hypothetical protein G6F68_000619 [Rhizopus microsporus]